MTATYKLAHPPSQSAAPVPPEQPTDAWFRAAFDALPDRVVILTPIHDPTGRIEDFVVAHVNEAAARFSGRTVEALIGRRLLDTFARVRASGLLDSLVRVVETGKPLATEMVLRTRRGPNGHAAGAMIDMRATRFEHGCVVSFRDVTEWSQSEQASRGTEAMFRAFFESPGAIRSIVEIVDSHMVRVEDNAEAAAFFAQAAASDRDSPNAHGATPPEIAALYLDRYAEAMRTGSHVRFEYPRPTSGHDRWFEATVSHLGTGPNGHPRFASAVMDITVRHRAQLALLERDEQLGAAQRTAHVGSWDSDLATGRNRWSDEMYRICGVTRAEFGGTTEAFLSLVHPDDRARVIQLDEAGIKVGEPYGMEFRILRPDGSTRTVEERIDVVHDATGTPGRLVGSLQDITERVAAEEERLRLMSALEQSGDAVVMGRIDGPVQYVNAAFERLYGYSRDEVLGQNLRMLKSGAHTREFWEDVWRRLGAGETFSGPIVNRRKDGSIVEVEAVYTGFRDAGGEPIGFISTHRDVTHVRTLEGQLRQAAKMEAIGQLAGGVAHDFNNMLTAIRGYSELVRLNLPPGDERNRSDLGQVILASERAAELTSQLLAFARRQVLAPRVVEPGEIVAGLAPLLRRLLGEQVELVIHEGGDGGRVRVDPAQLEQVIVNLAVNARDAMPNGGRLRIDVSDVDLDEGHMASHIGSTGGPHVQIVVSDTGTGISPAVLPRIFEPFFTTKPPGKGTGMGLATVYGIVQQSAGSIDVNSRPGQGTTFRINFPTVSAASDAPVRLPPEVASIPGGTETILLVEDQPSVRGFAHRALVELGYTVMDAASGTEAFAFVGESARGVDLLVTDVMMPGLKGTELAARMRSSRPGLRVLFISGFADAWPAGDGVESPAGAYLPKPFTTNALGMAVRTALDAAAPA